MKSWIRNGQKVNIRNCYDGNFELGNREVEKGRREGLMEELSSLLITIANSFSPLAYHKPKLKSWLG